MHATISINVAMIVTITIHLTNQAGGEELSRLVPGIGRGDRLPQIVMESTRFRSGMKKLKKYPNNNVGMQPVTEYQINDTWFHSANAETNPNTAPKMALNEFTRVVKMPKRNIPSNGPLKNPMIAAAASKSEPI